MQTTTENEDNAEALIHSDLYFLGGGFCPVYLQGSSTGPWSDLRSIVTCHLGENRFSSLKRFGSPHSHRLRVGQGPSGSRSSTSSPPLWVLRFATPGGAGPLEDADAAIKRRDYTTAVQLIRPLAEQGDANAQYKLAVFYDNSLGVPQDKVSAYMWLDCRRRRAEKVRQLFETLSHGA